LPVEVVTKSFDEVILSGARPFLLPAWHALVSFTIFYAISHAIFIFSVLRHCGALQSRLS